MKLNTVTKTLACGALASLFSACSSYNSCPTYRGAGTSAEGKYQKASHTISHSCPAGQKKIIRR